MKLIDSERHLPKFMRDFHDQKDVFKSVSIWGAKHGSNIGWVDAHCYVIDIFLQFMALHGYTLQKSRTKEKTYSIKDTIKERQDKEATAFEQMIKESQNER